MVLQDMLNDVAEGIFDGRKGYIKWKFGDGLKSGGFSHMKSSLNGHQRYESFPLLKCNYNC